MSENKPKLKWEHIHYERSEFNYDYNQLAPTTLNKIALFVFMYNENVERFDIYVLFATVQIITPGFIMPEDAIKNIKERLALTITIIMAPKFEDLNND